MERFGTILLAICVAGAINLGFVGFFNWNLINAVFGGDTAANMSGLVRVLYALVGLCGLIAAFVLPRVHVVGEHRVTPPMRT